MNKPIVRGQNAFTCRRKGHYMHTAIFSHAEMTQLEDNAVLLRKYCGNKQSNMRTKCLQIKKGNATQKKINDVTYTNDVTCRYTLRPYITWWGGQVVVVSQSAGLGIPQHSLHRINAPAR